MSSEYVATSADKAAKYACEFPLNMTYITDILKEKPIEIHCPINWVSSRSPNKCIGLREAKVIPNRVASRIVMTYFYILPPTADGEEEELTCDSIAFNILIKSEQTTQDIAWALSNAIQTCFDNSTGPTKTFEFNAIYDKCGKLTLELTTGEYKNWGWYFEDGWVALGDALGILEEKAYKAFVENDAQVKILDGIWDRCDDGLYIHSDISNDNYQIVCENYSKYSPKKYLFPYQNQTFKVWFSFDGEKIRYPLGCSLVLKLSFIYNFKTAAI